MNENEYIYAMKVICKHTVDNTYGIPVTMNDIRREWFVRTMCSTCFYDVWLEEVAFIIREVIDGVR